MLKEEMHMGIFEAVKSMVTPRIAVEHFGLNVSRNGMVCCPFHDDKHPSMKLYEDHYHCFGCQANGNVITFTSKLFGITPLEAAQKLADDFGIREGKPSVLAKLKMYTTQAENEKLCFQALSADDLRKERIPDFIFQVADFLLAHKRFRGTVSQLLAVVGNTELKPNLAGKHLTRHYSEVLLPLGITYEYCKTAAARLVLLELHDGADGHDG